MYVCMCVCVYVCMCVCMYEEEEEEICLFNIVCSYTNSAMLITYTCRETPSSSFPLAVPVIWGRRYGC